MGLTFKPFIMIMLFTAVLLKLDLIMLISVTFTAPFSSRSTVASKSADVFSSKAHITLTKSERSTFPSPHTAVAAPLISPAIRVIFISLLPLTTSISATPAM